MSGFMGANYCMDNKPPTRIARSASKDAVRYSSLLDITPFYRTSLTSTGS